jgi:cytochrome-b5 reductase
MALWWAARLSAASAAGLGLRCAQPPGEAAASAAGPSVLDAKTLVRSKMLGFVWRSWRRYELDKIEVLSPTTKRFRFLFEDSDIESGMRAVSCILGRVAPQKDAYVQTPLYPISRPEDKGFFEVVVKKTDDPVSVHLHGLRVGDAMEFKGALPVLPYRVGQYTTLGLIAGGTGVLPLYALIQEILSNPQETTRISLLYAARTKGELLLKKQLDALMRRHPQSFRVEYCVEERPWWPWAGWTGRITKEMVQENMPRPGRGVTIAVAGPLPMLDAVCGPTEVDKDGWVTQGPVKGLLNECGYRNHHVFKF